LTEKFASVALAGKNNDDLSILKEYADFWKVPNTTLSPHTEKHILVTSDSETAINAPNGNPIILSPKGLEGATEIARHFGLKMTARETLVCLPISPGFSVSLLTKLLEFSGTKVEPVLEDRENILLCRIKGQDVYLLSVDLVSEYNRLLYDRMDERPNWRFRLVTRMPLSYRLIPARIRNRFFKAKENAASLREEALAPIEFLRSLFLASLTIASENPIPTIAFWRRGKSYALAVSHDVETQLGLEDGAARLMEAEKEMGIRSTWNIPSDRYPLSTQLLKVLSENGEIGGHDTKHDGRLFFESKEAKLERVRRCRERLEELSGRPVSGFRAPLLQHSRELVEELGKAGYEYDSSMPSWELLSPTSFKPHGIGTVFPLVISGVIEIPVSLPQDHQLIRVGGLAISEAVDQLLKVSRWIMKTQGACVMLVHPDYEFGQEDGRDEYLRLLSSFRSDPACDIMTLGEMAQWWLYRQGSNLDEQGRINVRSGVAKGKIGELGLDLITGYGSDGFKREGWSDASLVELPKSSGLRS
jgi:Polysaccharide deacetylase